MAKRAPKGERPFNPLDEALVRSVISGSGRGAEAVGEGGGAAVAEAERPPRIAPSEASERKVVPMPEPRTEPKGKAESRPARADLDYVERRDREKRVLLTASEERDVERLVERMAGELGTRIKLSHVLRACYLMLMHAEDELLDRARKAPRLSRPGNGNAPEIAEFERAIAAILSGAFREAPPLR